jgi:hypothetical protein
LEICKECGEEITAEQSDTCNHMCGACYKAYERTKIFSSNILLISGIILALNGILLVIVTFLPQINDLIVIRVLSGISAIICLIVSSFLLYLRVEEKDKSLV